MKAEPTLDTKFKFQYNKEALNNNGTIV